MCRLTSNADAAYTNIRRKMLWLRSRAFHCQKLNVILFMLVNATPWLASLRLNDLTQPEWELTCRAMLFSHLVTWITSQLSPAHHQACQVRRALGETHAPVLWRQMSAPLTTKHDVESCMHWWRLMLPPCDPYDIISQPRPPPVVSSQAPNRAHNRART